MLESQKKYGLIKKPAKSVRQALNYAVSKIFKSDDDDGESSEVKHPVLSVKSYDIDSIRKRVTEDTDIDPSIFNYDENYDEFKSSREKIQAVSLQNSDSLKPKYVTDLLSTAKVREREKNRIFERNLLKERKKEDEIFGDTPKFVTSAYKKKLLEDKKWEYEDKLAEELEKKTDFRGKGMEGFYAGLLTKNVTMGNSVESNAISAYTSGSRRQDLVDGDKLLEISPDVPPASAQSPPLLHPLVDDSPRYVESTSVGTRNSSIQTEPLIDNHRDEGGSSSNKEEVATDPPPHTVDRKDAISLAKERFLNRKRKGADT